MTNLSDEKIAGPDKREDPSTRSRSRAIKARFRSPWTISRWESSRTISFKTALVGFAVFGNSRAVFRNLVVEGLP